MMRRIRIDAGAYFLLAALVLTERADALLIYVGCAFAHELGHLFAARSRGIAIEQIRIGLTGARICTREGAGSYFDELILALSGPLVNVAAVAYGVFIFNRFGISAVEVLGAAERFALGGRTDALGVWAFVIACAAVQGAVNLLPVRTLDGGRVLYCLCALTLGQRAAERVLSFTSGMCAIAIWLAALYLMLKVHAGLGIYAFCACLFVGTLRDGELIEK